MTERRASLFFTTDTILAVIVIVSVFLLIQSSYGGSGQTADPQRASLELTRFMKGTNVLELETKYADLYSPPNYDAQTDPWRSEFTVYQEIAYLRENGLNSIASELAKNTTQEVLSPRFDYEIQYNGTQLYIRNTTPKSEASNLVAQRELVYTQIDNGQTTIGPRTVTVNIWI